MKIWTDSTWGFIYAEDHHECLLDFSRDHYAYQTLIDKIFNNTQQLRHIEQDGLFTLSKKAEKILLEEIEKHKT